MTQAIADKSSAKSARYELLDDLGGGQTATHLARDRDTGDEVIVKMLDVRQSDEWKAVELFEREAELLAALDHPAIPKLLDAFVEQDEAGHRARLFLVQEYVEGTDLARAVEEGFRVDEERAKQIARELLEVSSYLHAQDPPVIHRDIKPANIIRGTSDDGSERLHLVDFGAVGRFVSAKGGSTVIGTAGYVPTEQLAGRATPASDLYALGATLVYLLSRRPPSELPVERMRLAFRKVTNVSEEFAEFLDRLLAPAPEDRPKDATQALAELDSLGSKLPVRWSGSIDNQPRRLRPPSGTKITVDRRPDHLEVYLPHAYGHYGLSLMLPFGYLAVAVASSEGLSALAGIALFTLLAVVPYVVSRLIDLRLVLTPERFERTYGCLGMRFKKSLPTEQFEGFELGNVSAVGSQRSMPGLIVKSSAKDDELTIPMGISKAERRWIAKLFEPEAPEEPDE
ncbi:serine/threonine protein kinase [Persicimonas caeni]|uniref:non-specific serine/threonine protein kinase n=1 Tax=Persicimonas caeni TaxID=2292766 RepID=A0A4Y6PS75_PERCE|nr:serine/threonine-protein kinase [Persicimonas caeni]QDG51171.1 serine/threonine protein kinase [Persicimonas caeni]QED32392.1 serine/threonine protein kinase [Persicimonas caeni]